MTQNAKQLSRTKAVLLLFACLLFLAGTAYAIVRIEDRDNTMKVYFLDVGQGDAIFIEAPNGVQVLVDGGPDAATVRALGRTIPFYDRSIDMLVVTNPDKDHINGFIDVLERYRVSHVVEPGTKTNTETYKLFRDRVAAEAAPTVIARQGTRFMLDPRRGAYLEVLFPDQDVSEWKTNDGSIVARLVYGGTSVLLAGDAPKETEEYLVAQGMDVSADILKAGHHGSRTSSSAEFVAAVAPTYAVISAGKNNRYGHPHQEVVDILGSAAAEVLRTSDGTVRFLSDGKTFRQKKNPLAGILQKYTEQGLR